MSVNCTASRKEIRNLKAVTTLRISNKTAFVFKTFLGGRLSVQDVRVGLRAHKSRVITKSVTPAKRSDAFARDKHKCTKCGSTKNFGVDHIKPQGLFPKKVDVTF